QGPVRGPLVRLPAVAAAGAAVHRALLPVRAGAVDTRLRARARGGGGPGEAIGGVSLTIEPGETVALVGQTGAGKSTIVKLIARFYDVTGGAVLVDRVDVRTYDLPQGRPRAGVVPPEGELFSGTVADAIAYARPSASLAEIQAAAAAVGAHE